ncbi:MAG: ACP S-malonyltransferase [Gemmatimonadaceae bacterium]|nr:ACP S-malonyltransferase [Gemmatimonadaceae bacterium]
MDIVLLFPGQGSQKPGMAKDLVNAFPEARDVFSSVDSALGTSLSTLCFDGPAEELTATHNAQPALLTHGAAVWAVVKEKIRPHVRAAAGHSLGEFSAYHAAGSLSLESAAQLVRKRGQLMHEAGTARPGTMAALLGTMSESVDSMCAKASTADEIVVPANYNSPEQIVVSGEVNAVERVMALAKAVGAKRAIRLPVAGAFHSPLMAPAADGLRRALDSSDIKDPSFPVYSNVTTNAVTSAAEAADLLVKQLTSPVRWVDLIRNIAAALPAALFVEMGPGSVLTGLLPRIVPGLKSQACGTPADVEKLLAQVQS